MKIYVKGGCWPTPLQELLLKAALLDGEPALSAFRRWHAENGLERLDLGAYRTLPLLYFNLERLKVSHPVLGRLRGIHRRAWTENQMLFARLSPVVKSLHDAGIPPLLLKGAALALLNYRDPGLRPMQDLDVLVPEERALEVMRLLSSQGWERAFVQGVSLGEPDLRLRHSVQMKNPDCLEFDLHWHVLYFARQPGVDQVFWEASVPLDFRGIPVRALCPTDHLLLTICHGPMWNAVPPIRWVSDAWVLLQDSEIDWNRLLALTEELKVTLYVRSALNYLVETLGAPIPAEALKVLAGKKIAGSEILLFERTQEPLVLQSVVGTIRAIYNLYHRGVSDRNLGQRLAGFPRFMQLYWGRRTQSEVLRLLVQWVLWRAGITGRRPLLEEHHG